MDADEGADDNNDESIVSPLRVGDTNIYSHLVPSNARCDVCQCSGSKSSPMLTLSATV